jgi:Bacterial sugar transferase
MAKGLALNFGGILVSIATKLFGDELKAWVPWLAERLLRSAAKRLPEGHKERFTEEWASHVDEVPGNIGKLATAVGCILAAHQIASLLKYGETLPIRFLRRSLDVVASLLILFWLTPLMSMVALLLKLECRGSRILSGERRLGALGVPFVMYRFRLGTVETTIETWDGQVRKKKRLSLLGYFLWQSSVHELPQLLNVLRGEMTLTGQHGLRERYRGTLPPAGYLDPFYKKSWKELLRASRKLNERYIGSSLRRKSKSPPLPRLDPR